MLSFVKLNDNGGIWANRYAALLYMAKGFKIFTDVDEKNELTEEDLLNMVEYEQTETTEEHISV